MQRTRTKKKQNLQRKEKRIALRIIVRELGAPTTYHGRHARGAPSFEVISRSRSSRAHSVYMMFCQGFVHYNYFWSFVSSQKPCLRILRQSRSHSFALLPAPRPPRPAPPRVAWTIRTYQHHCMNGSAFYAMLGYFGHALGREEYEHIQIHPEQVIPYLSCALKGRSVFI